MLLVHLASSSGRLGYQCLLDEFWEQAGDLGLRLPDDEIPSAQAFCAARQKLKADLLRVLVEAVSNDVSASVGGDGRWLGHRVFAVDGSKVSLQRSRELDAAFGTPPAAHLPQILVSTIFDVVTACPHFVSVARNTIGERTELLGMLDHLPIDSVIVLDRGYPSFEVMSEVLRRGLHFVIRLPSDLFGAVRKFVQDRGDYEIVTIQPPSKWSAKYNDAIDVRAVYLSNGGADPTILITDLVSSRYTATKIGEIYTQRWQIEEFYKQQNASVFTIEQCRSRLKNGVEQEVYGFALFLGLSRHLAVAAAARAEVPLVEIARKPCMLALARCLAIAILMEDATRAHQKIDRTVAVLAKRRAPVRPGRHYPRVSYKPRKRWHAKGKS